MFVFITHCIVYFFYLIYTILDVLLVFSIRICSTTSENLPIRQAAYLHVEAEIGLLLRIKINDWPPEENNNMNVIAPDN